MAIQYKTDSTRQTFMGLSTDSKPSNASDASRNIGVGDLFYETDTQKMWRWSGFAWVRYTENTALYAYQSTSLSYIPLTTDGSGNLNVTGAGSTGGAVYPDTTHWTLTGTSANVNLTNTSVAVTGGTAPNTSTGNAATFATVGVTSAAAVALNASRKGLILVNTSANNISIAFGATAAVLNSGITLTPNGSYEMDAWSFTTQAVNAIASAASSNLSIQEFQ